MGCKFSKDDDGQSTAGSDQTRNVATDRRSIVSSFADFDKRITEELRQKLESEPDKFVLNNMLLCIMFFKSYKELGPFRTKFIETKSETVNLGNHNTTLLSENKMMEIEPDCILKIVNKHVSYRPKHGPNKSISEPLAARRIFLIDDRVEMVSLDDEDNLNEYDTVDKPRYQFYMEFTKRKGFVKFIFKEDPNNDDNDKTNINDTEDKQNSEEELYKEVTYSRTPKPIGGKFDFERRDTNLPSECFKSIQVEDYEAAKNLNKGDEIDVQKLYKKITYLDSKMYMKHFKNNSFHIAAETLGFNEDAIKGADYIAGKVLCTVKDGTDGCLKQQVPWEIIPAVTIEWPTEYAYDFVDREERPVRNFLETGKQVKWPSDKVIQDIIKTKAVAIPKGYTPKKGKNPESDIEWEICFPKAEHILQCTMNHCQIRCYLYLLAIHKHFIEPKTKQQGLLPEHIRMHMFWEMETTFNWSDIEIFDKLLSIIDNLVERLGCQSLPDFFIKQRNLFENIPSQYLLTAQEVFHSILQRPLMRLLSALRNIKYNTDSYYSTLDFDKLHENLVKKAVVERKGFKKIENIYDESDPRQKWNNILQETYKKNTLKNLNEPKEERKNSIDSINLDWTPTGDLTFINRREILTIFIKNFIGIFTKSMDMSTPQQTIRYCKLTTYLTNIYQQLYPTEIDKVADFRRDIQQYEEHAKIKLSKTSRNKPPTPPLRPSVVYGEALKQDDKGNNSYKAKNSSTVALRPRKLYIKAKTSRLVSNSEENVGSGEVSPSSPTKNVSFNLDTTDSSNSTPDKNVNFNFITSTSHDC
ncbi:unnamed protein product [Brassicogethes aeneus]|uniref:Mab-21-like HhH/H2TH-like domain-containing protein n=1 Tax=Brassicogethes aeneus TaxID=1431903 RepID=A0A9P0B485_BRAAE|nr:unnamed protein product [Brassicogethes aeneus]